MKTPHRLFVLTAFAALAISGCASPFGPSSAVPAAQRPASELPNRVVLPSVGMGSPSGAAQSNAAAPAATIARPAGAATPAPKQAAPEPVLQFCVHRADFKPAAPVCSASATAFGPGVARINGVWPVSAWPGASLSGRWYVNGKPASDPPGARTRALCWDGKPEALGFTRSGLQFVSLSAQALGAASLAEGAYRFELYVDDKLILAEGFGIGAYDPALISAAPTAGVVQPCQR